MFNPSAHLCRPYTHSHPRTDMMSIVPGNPLAISTTIDSSKRMKLSQQMKPLVVDTSENNHSSRVRGLGFLLRNEEWVLTSANRRWKSILGFIFNILKINTKPNQMLGLSDVFTFCLSDLYSSLSWIRLFSIQCFLYNISSQFSELPSCAYLSNTFLCNGSVFCNGCVMLSLFLCND